MHRYNQGYPPSSTVLFILPLALVLALMGCQDAPISSPSEEPTAKSGSQSSIGPSPSATCDVTVPDDATTIQAGVSAATEGETVCVEAGTYEEDVTVNKPLTVQGRAALRSSNSAVVDGSFTVNPGGDGTTIRRFQITSSETFAGGASPDPFGVLVKASDVRVENNIIADYQADLSNGEGNFSLNGVQIFGAEGENVSDVTVRNNVIRGFESTGIPDEWPKHGGIAGVKIQAAVEGVTVTGNRITDHHSAGWVWGVVLTPSGSAPGVPEDVTIKENMITSLNDGSVYDVFKGENNGRNQAPYPGSAIGIDLADGVDLADGIDLADGMVADASEATVRRNNLLAPNGVETKDPANTLTAECNWWGARSGPTHETNNPSGSGSWALEWGKANIQFSPWLIAPVPSRACIGGKRFGRGVPGPGKGPGSLRNRGPGR